MKEFLKDHLKECSHIPLFFGISSKDLLPMLQCLGSYIKTYKKGEFILLTEEAVKCVGVILEGSVKMIKEDLWGNKTILAVMEKEELFGETFTCGSTIAATVTFVAGKEAKVLYLPFERVMHSCSRSCVYHHRLIENMVTLIANKNVQLMEKLEIITKKTLREKISCFLSIQAQRNNSRYFTTSMGRVELSEYLCADRSALTRELNLMKSEGLIDFDKNTFKILKEFPD
ncbi:Crp/Fnr family transcriptional regulator [Clostridium sp. Marseille-P2415]|uniref:Crp/Fnr family transcriptional regulator n=1 Tax=Clostridium sp. Marseille-P2415 TaxID=1805471 RepID=UPI0009884B07|nr:Crp/Fnr family transcriptional regulator [Clostridium sp. Marseille-P2415]